MELSQSDLIEQAWLRLTSFTQFGPARLLRILRHFNDPRRALESDAQTLTLAGIEQHIAEQFMSFREDPAWMNRWEVYKREQIHITVLGSTEYPALLSQIHHPPVVLYWRGTINQPWDTMISVVGTRALSLYGKTVTPTIVEELGRRGIGIVSGLALGIDGLAHQASLATHQATVAVIAGGVDNASIFPSAHLNLAQDLIAHGGCLMSEYPPLTLPLKYYFPLRNRIVAGLTRATLVIEADTHSGALITSKSALEENREVFAVPGPITSPTSAGTNGLIRLGARCVSTAEELLADLEIVTELRPPAHHAAPKSDDPDEQAILQVLTQEPVDVDTIIRSSQLPVTTVQRTLSLLELKGWARQVGPTLYVLHNA